MAFNPPTREQIARMANGDQRMIRALEELFRVVGQDVAGDLDKVRAAVQGLGLSGGLALAQTTAAILTRVEERSKSNEVMAWLSTQ